MSTRSISLLLVLLLIISLTACNEAKTGSKEKEPEKTHADITKIQDTAQENTMQDKNADSEFVFPAEGKRPFAVMIDNEGSRCLPQGGLDKAQVIYEMVAEGGVTRLMALFWGTKPEMIGPVRSSRHYFLDFAMENDAIYVHYGWSPMAKADIPKFKINNINGLYVDGVFWDITKDRRNWQDSYTSMDKLEKYVQKVNYRTTTDKKQVFSFSKHDFELPGSQKAENVKVVYNRYYSCAFTYDAASKEYKRFRKDDPQIERVSGKQLMVRNIIIEQVRNIRIKGDTKDRQEVYDVGSGDGWLITSGKAVRIKWSKESRTAPTRYVDGDGKDIQLNPGLTWVQLVSLSGTVKIN